MLVVVHFNLKYYESTLRVIRHAGLSCLVQVAGTLLSSSINKSDNHPLPVACSHT